MNTKPIGIFDSGIGGISTLDECIKLMREESYIYLFDAKFSPYGNRTDLEIKERVFECAKILKDEGAKAVLIACNTATGVAISELRRAFDIPFVGVEPAIKPSYERVGDAPTLLLCTIATAKQQNFNELVSLYGSKKLIVAPQAELASLIEKNIENLERIRDRVYGILKNYKDVKSVILGCTHYCFIRPMVRDFYGSRVKIFDGNYGAAKRLLSVLEADGLINEDKNNRFVKFMST